MLGAIALVGLTVQTMAQLPSSPTSTTPVPTTTPVPIPTQTTTEKDKIGKKRPPMPNKGDRKEGHGDHKKGHGDRKEGHGERKEERAEKMDKIKNYLNLSATQEDQMKTVVQTYRTAAKGLKDNAQLSKEQKKTQLEQLKTDRNNGLKAILTPEQLMKFAQAQKQGRGGKVKNSFINEEMGDDD